jgi:hypothetical protein
MRYTAPQIIDVRNATETIQSIGLPPDQKNPGPISDSPVPLPTCSEAAYESDE